LVYEKWVTTPTVSTIESAALAATGLIPRFVVGVGEGDAVGAVVAVWVGIGVGEAPVAGVAVGVALEA